MIELHGNVYTLKGVTTTYNINLGHNLNGIVYKEEIYEWNSRKPVTPLLFLLFCEVAVFVHVTKLLERWGQTQTVIRCTPTHTHIRLKFNMLLRAFSRMPRGLVVYKIYLTTVARFSCKITKITFWCSPYVILTCSYQKVAWGGYHSTAKSTNHRQRFSATISTVLITYAAVASWQGKGIGGICPV